MPKFSVIIPLYNKEKSILKTINSVFNQLYTDFEIIVVNDGSTDNSFKEITKIKHDKLIAFNNTNKGVSEARNFAMQQANGDYFAFLDADDVWEKNHLLNLNNLISSFPNCGLYCCNYNFDYGNNNIISTQFPSLPKDLNWQGIVPDYFLASLKYRIAWTSAVAIPKDIINSIGFFDNKITLGAGEDTDYWTRIALKRTVAFTKKISVSYNISAENRISNINTSKRKFMKLDKFYEDEKTNLSLKKFNDIQRAELAIKHKIIGDKKSSIFYITHLKFSNIGWIKLILLHSPKFILILLWKIKQWLKTKKIEIYT